MGNITTIEGKEMIINLKNYLTLKNDYTSIGLDGCRNPEIGGNNDIVILDTDLTSYRRVAIHYTRLSRLLEGKVYRVDQFRLSNNPAYLFIRKLKLDTTMSTSISSLYQDYQQLSGFLSYYSGSDELGDKLYALQDFICDRIICSHATTPAELLIKLELFQQQVKQENFYKDYQDLAELLESSLIDLRKIA